MKDRDSFDYSLALIGLLVLVMLIGVGFVAIHFLAKVW